jgi:hypothetical protein
VVYAENVIEMAVETIAAGDPFVINVDEDESTAQSPARPEVGVERHEGMCVRSDDMDSVAARYLEL